jgi:cellobiose transport system substrate-binding protein
MTKVPSHWVRLGAVVAVGALALTACGDSGSKSGDSSNSSTPVTLKINFWGDFGLKQLVPEYEKAHPNVHIVLNSGDYNQQHQNLQKYLVAGSGAPDIAAIDEGFIVQFRNQADKFVNLLSLPGGSDFQSKYLPWKWKESLSGDGKTQIGLGTDVGGQAMCYRRDLFAKAGLPSDRDKVSALWPTWQDFINVGKQYVAGIKDPKKKFVDAASNIMNPVLSQQPVGYIDQSEQLAMDQGPKAAWDVATAAIQAGISANLTAYTPEWNAAFKNGAFAVLACPAWQLGYIQQEAPATKGNWDIAAIPGGGGNWGGSFLTIPKQGKHQKEAWDFIKWVVQPAQQIAIFKTVGNLPSQPALYDDPALKAFTNPFFNNAPVGVIFPQTALKLTPQYLGKKSGAVRVAVENVLVAIQQGKINGDAAWKKAVTDAQKAATG